MLSKKAKTALVAGLILILLWLSLIISRIGEVKLTVSAIPSEAEILINQEKIKGKEVYVKPGAYTVSANYEGYEEDSVVVEVGSAPVVVELIPEPESEEARSFLDENPEIQAEREAIGGRRYAKQGQDVRERIPILNSLPVTEILGPFSIDYGLSDSRKDGVFLEISDSSPQGRVNALKWLRQNGQDPTDFEIRYSDFTNPLMTTGRPE